MSFLCFFTKPNHQLINFYPIKYLKHNFAHFRYKKKKANIATSSSSVH